jgi:hypothetical protein
MPIAEPVAEQFLTDAGFDPAPDLIAALIQAVGDLRTASRASQIVNRFTIAAPPTPDDILRMGVRIEKEVFAAQRVTATRRTRP